MATTAKEAASSGLTFIERHARSFKSFATGKRGTLAVNEAEIAQQNVANISRAISDATSVYVANTKADAAMRQGTLEAVNAVDNANKRSGFMKFLFGQDVGYETALGIAVKNATQNAYMQELLNVPQNIDKSPQDYWRTLNDTVVDNMMELYKDDPMAQKIAMTQWDEKARTLAHSQASQHLVYRQEQLHQEGTRDILGGIDEVSLLMNENATVEMVEQATAELQHALRNAFVYTAPDGQSATPEASKAMQVEAVTEALRAGNMFVMRNLPEDFDSKLNKTQRNKMYTARQEYDNKIANNGEYIVEKALLSYEMGSVEGMMRAMKELDEQKIQLSGTTSSKEKWTEDKRRVLNHMNALKKKLAKETVSNEATVEYYRAREDQDKGRTGALWTKKRQEEADDLVVMHAAGMLADDAGEPEPEQLADAINYTLTNRGAMQIVANRAHRFGSVSPKLAESIRHSVMNMTADENGMLTQDALSTLDNIQVLYNLASAEVRGAMGADANALVQITLNNRYKSLQEIEHKRNEYIKNKGINLSTQDLNLPKKGTRAQYISKLIGTPNADVATTMHYDNLLQEGFRIYGGDLKAAEDYVRTQKLYNDADWRGTPIINGRLSDVDVPSALSAMEHSGLAQQLIMSRVGHMESDKPITGFGQLPNLQLSVVAGSGDVLISSSRFTYPISLTAEELKAISTQAMKNKQREEDDKVKAMEEKNRVKIQQGLMRL